MMKKSDESQTGLSGQKPGQWNNTQKYVIALLLLVHMFNLMDRQIINVLSPATVSYTHLTLPTNREV